MMDYYMKAIGMFCLLSLAAANRNFQQNTLIDLLHQYCTSQMTLTSTGETRRSPVQARIGKAGPQGPPGIVNYTAINEKLAEKYLDLESRIQENVERIVNRVLDKSSAKMEEIRNETRRVIEEYRREENGIDGKIEEFERTVNGKLEEINVKIEKMQNKSEEGISENRTDQGEMTSRSTSGSSKTTESPHQATTSTKARTESTTTSIGVPCTNGMMYGNKCFIPVVDRIVNYDDGVAICEGLGGQLANIYSQTHMDDVMKYIRDNRLGDRYFRLGMKYDPKADKLTLRDGTDAPAGLKWWPGFPFTVEAYGEGVAVHTNVILHVHSDPSSTWEYKYLVNYPPRSGFYVLCEIE